MSNPEKTEDTRPRRAGSKRGQKWPVIRTYYDPATNCVMDVLEVTKTVAGKYGNPPETVVLNMIVHCQDEDLKAQYESAKGQVEIQNVEVK